MNRTIAICATLAWIGVWLAIVVAAPWMLSDANEFLNGFVNHEFLGFMGVIVTITLASAANLHIELNKLEDRLNATLFTRTRRDLRHSAFSLIAALIAAIILVILKPILSCGERAEAGLNGVAITILLASIMILIDLTQAAFSLSTRD